MAAVRASTRPGIRLRGGGRRRASAIYRGCIDDLAGNPTGLLPIVGVGVALTETVGYDPEVLLNAARAAAQRASRSLEASVLFGGIEDGGTARA